MNNSSNKTWKTACVITISGLLLMVTLVVGPQMSNSNNNSILSTSIGYHNRLAITPQMGWNPWNVFGCDNINETLIMDIGQAMIGTGLNNVGYEYINLDDCWQSQERNTTGYIIEDTDKFPSGMAQLRNYLHDQLGLKFGLYSDSGNMTCQRRMGSFGYEKQDAALYAEWKIDYLKYDNCYTKGTDTNVRIRYQRMHDALNETGYPILFSMCEWGIDHPATWAGPIANSWRTTGDIRPNWSSMISNLDENNKWYKYAHPGGWNDPDILEVGNTNSDSTLTIAEQRSHFTLWCLMNAPLLLGNDLRSIPKKIMDIISNQEIIAVNQDPLGIQGYKRWSSSSNSDNNDELVEVWAGDLTGGDVAVVLFNRSGKNRTITAKFNDVITSGVYTTDNHIDSSSIDDNNRNTYHSFSAHVRDLWAHSGLGIHWDEVSAIVPSHDCVALRLSNITMITTS